MKVAFTIEGYQQRKKKKTHRRKQFIREETGAQ